ncbi:MAG TPA: hypothetical protein VGC41_13575 [Kofleriaceae bacterium]
MQNINLSDLESVTGGNTTSSTHYVPSGSGSSSGCNNDQLLTSLNGISSSIKNISSQNNQGPFGGSGGAMMLGMALAMRNRQQTSVYVGRHGYAWQSSW